MMMNKELIGVLFLAFVPCIVLVIAGAVSMVRNYGVAFLWCLRFEPVREKLTSILHEMHPEAPVVTEAEYTGQQPSEGLFPSSRLPVEITRPRRRTQRSCFHLMHPGEVSLPHHAAALEHGELG